MKKEKQKNTKLTKYSKQQNTNYLDLEYKNKHTQTQTNTSTLNQSYGE